MIFLQIFISLLVQVFALFYLYYTSEPESSIKKTKGRIFVILSFGFTVAVALIARNYSENLVGFIKIMMLYQILYCAAIVDYRKKMIPNILVAFGVIFRYFCFFFEIIWYQTNWKVLLIQDLMGLFIGAGVLLLVYFFAKKGIGMGDIKLFCVIGITCGFQLTYSILFLAVLLAACYGMIQMLINKHNKHHEMAFAPFIFLGYIFSIILSIL